MSRRALLRVSALLLGAALPLLSAGVAHADLPPLPLSGVGVNIVYQPPDAGIGVIPPPPGTCYYDTSFDNTATNPPGTIYRGETACGAGIIDPVLSGQVSLLDALGNVVSVGSGFSQVGGLGIAQGDYVVQGTSGPVPGLVYTIQYDQSITLSASQYWTAPGPGCTVSGRTLSCRVSVMYNYIPGTEGGHTPG